MKKASPRQEELHREKGLPAPHKLGGPWYSDDGAPLVTHTSGRPDPVIEEAKAVARAKLAVRKAK